MKKIGTITFHNALNYGAVLQAFSLREQLEKLGTDAKIIDYTSREVVSRYSFKGLKTSGSIKLFILNNLQYLLHIGRKKKFRNFLYKFCKLTAPCDNKGIKNLAYEFDAVITGSDQVWNPTNTKCDTTFLLDFVSDDVDKIAYGPSLGTISNFNMFGSEGVDLIKRFKAISLREKDSCEAFENMGLKTTHVVDPVFLTNAQRWSDIVKTSSDGDIKEPYIFIYNVRASSDVFNFAKELSLKTGLKVYSNNIILKADIMTLRNGFKLLPALSPEGFLKMLKNAEYVVTDSFHGTSFCIIFKKKFFVASDKRKNNTNSRLTSLLSICDLNNRFIDNSSSLVHNDDINYNAVYSRLEPEINASKEFIKSVIM